MHAALSLQDLCSDGFENMDLGLFGASDVEVWGLGFTMA